MGFNLEFKTHQYKRMLEGRKGNNFEYWNDVKHGKMLENGWHLWTFSDRNKGLTEATTSKDEAKGLIPTLRSLGFARIVCGYYKDAQRRKYYSVIYKPKK